MTISSLGVGSGLDAESIISSLMAVEKKPLTALQSQESDIKTKLSSFGQMQSLFADLQTTSQSLSSVLLWNQTTATSSDTSAVTVSSDSGAAIGSYAVKVTNLAVAQTATSRAFSSSTSTLNAGSLTIELGAWTGDPVSGFTAKTGASPVTVNIADGKTSLADIRDAINNAGAGVTATIINDASGARLSITSKDTGVENAFRITASETTDDGDATTGLSALAYDPLGGSSQLTLNQAAEDATATINGISITSDSNTLENVADGLTVNLLKETSSAVGVSVAQDTQAVSDAIDAFVKAFNALASEIKTDTKYDASSKKAGPLQGDRTAVGLQNQLRAILNQTSSASSMYTHLSDIGLAMKSDGTLEKKTSKLSDAMSTPAKLAELRKLFATDSGSSASSGFMVRYRDLASKVLGTDGALTTVSASLSAQIRDLDKRQDALNDRLTATEARLRAQYEALDAQMANLSGLSNYVASQLKALG